MIQFDNAVDKFNQLILNELKDVGIDCWIAGGAIRDYFMGLLGKGKGKEIDYDLFFPNEIEYEKAKTFFKTKEAKIIWESENGMKVKYNKRIYDLVKIFFKDPQDTINNFDFTVSMFAIGYDKVYYGETSFIDLSKRQLMLNKIPYPASTMKRAFKYYEKGFLMCADEMKKLVEAINSMPTLPMLKKELIKINNRQINLDEESSGNGFFRGID